MILIFKLGYEGIIDTNFLNQKSSYHAYRGWLNNISFKEYIQTYKHASHSGLILSWRFTLSSSILKLSGPTVWKPEANTPEWIPPVP